MSVFRINLLILEFISPEVTHGNLGVTGGYTFYKSD